MNDKVAASVIEGFRGQPMLLLVLVLNIIFLVLVYFGVEASGARRHAEMTSLLDKCFNPSGGR